MLSGQRSESLDMLDRVDKGFDVNRMFFVDELVLHDLKIERRDVEEPDRCRPLVVHNLEHREAVID